MRKLMWIVALLVCAGCVVSQPSQNDKAAPVGKSAESVEKTISKSASPTPVMQQETAPSRLVARQNMQPVKTSAPISSPIIARSENARVVKIDAAPAQAANAKAQKNEAPPTSVVKQDEPPANIIIKGTPKETKPESNGRLAAFGQKKILWAGVVGCVVVGGLVFAQRNGKSQGAKGKNSKGKNEAKDEMEKAWKKGGVF